MMVPVKNKHKGEVLEGRANENCTPADKKKNFIPTPKDDVSGANFGYQARIWVVFVLRWSSIAKQKMVTGRMFTWGE
jgi:hypothetical protein